MAERRSFTTPEVRQYLKRYNKLKETARKYGQDIHMIERAFSFMESACRGYRRKDGSPYTVNCVEIGMILAEMNCDSKMIAAGLLHDVMELKRDSAAEIRRLLGDEVEQILAAGADMEECLSCGSLGIQDPEEAKERRNRVESIALETGGVVLFVISAVRVHNLLNMGPEDSGRRIEAANITRELLIPVVRDVVQAYSLTDRLRDACLKAENEENYMNIRTQYDWMASYNRSCIERFAAFAQRELNKWSDTGKYAAQLFFRDRSVNSIYNDILAKADKGGEIIKHMNKRTVPLQDIFFVVKDDCPQAPEDVFLEFYTKLHEGVFPAEGKKRFPETFSFTAVALKKSVNSGLNYIVCEDCYDNRWRVFCEHKSDFRNYRHDYGVEEFKKKMKTPSKPPVPMMVVYTRSMEIVKIEEGATVLDFAFKIHSGLAYGAKYAYINGRKERVFLYERLNPGDKVEIISSTSVDSQEVVDNSTVRWLNWVHTRKAYRKLIRHLEEREIKARPLIMVTDAESGESVSIVGGAVPLDLAFLLDPERALCFREAYLGREKQPCEIGRRLNYNDRVRIIYGDEPGAGVEWLRYVQTEKARNALIDYLQTKE